MLALTSNFVQAQDNDDIDTTINEEDEDKPYKFLGDEKYKLGIKLGTQLSTLNGDENDKNTFRFGINGGVYVRKKFKREKFGYQLELNGSIRGSYFDRVTPDDYSLLRLAYIDFPALLFMNFNKSEKQKILIGPQFSYLVSATMYKGDGFSPYDVDPKLNVYDVLACAGYQLNLGRITFQTMLKYGFMNINNGLIKDIKPANQGKNMNNAMIEFNILF